MASLEAEMLEHIRRALDDHAKTCPMQPRAILLHPGNHEMLGWDELWGIPVLADDCASTATDQRSGSRAPSRR